MNTSDEHHPSKWHNIPKDLLRWLVLAPVVLLMLFCCGWISLLGMPTMAAGEIRSNLDVDYQPWPPALFQPVSTAIIDDVIRDSGTETSIPTQFLATGDFWPTSVFSRTPTRTPTSTPMPSSTRTSTSTPTPTQTATSTETLTETPTNTNTATITRTYLPPTLTPTRPTSTQADTATSTQPPTNTASLPPSLTNTPTSTLVPTSTPTSTNTPTPTNTFTPSTTPTQASILPLLEGTVEPGVDSCIAYWGYNNPNTYNVSFSAGSATNQFSPGGNQGQPSDFLPGRQVSVFSVVWTGGLDLIWQLDGSSATAPWCTPITPTPTPTPTSTPTQIVINMPNGGEISCGAPYTIDLGQEVFMRYLVYTEDYLDSIDECPGIPSDPPPGPGICMDWVYLDFCRSEGSCVNSLFNWGDGNLSNNGSLGSSYSSEDDNQGVPAGSLTGGDGITVWINDAFRYIIIGTNDCGPPQAYGDPAEVHAITIYP